MNKLQLGICAVLTFVFGMASHVDASLVTDPATLTQGGDYYLGSINDGVPSSPGMEVDYINNLITLDDEDGDTVIGTETYNRVGSFYDDTFKPFPTANTTTALKDESDGVVSLDLGSAVYTYILGKYDQSDAGSLVWYFPMGVTGTVTPQSTFNGKGLSHISAYNFEGNIPEPVSVLVWGGLAVAAIGGSRFWRRRKVA